MKSTYTFEIKSSHALCRRRFSFDEHWYNRLNIITMNLIYFRAEPDLEFEGLLKRQHTRVKYFQGSLMNAMDLERSKVTRASILGGRV